MEKPANLVIESAVIRKRNFEGRGDDYNAEGQRNFRLVIPDENAQELSDQGWNVKDVCAKETGEHIYYYILIKVSYKYFGPRINVISNGRMYAWGEEDVARIDSLDIENVDLEISASHWERSNGKEGITAYLREMYITLKDSKLSEKYGAMMD